MTKEGWHGPLTKLVRLAQNEPEAESWISAMLIENMPEIIADAVAVALETGDPMPALLAKAVADHPSPAGAEKLARMVPVRAPLLQSSAIAAVDQLLADPDWPPDVTEDERAVRRYALQVAQTSRLAGAGRLAEARTLAERMIELADDLPAEDAVRARLVDAYDIVCEAQLVAGDPAAVKTATLALEIRLGLDDQHRLPAEGRIMLAEALRADGSGREAVEILSAAADELTELAKHRRDPMMSIEDAMAAGAEEMAVSVRIGWLPNGFDEPVLDSAWSVDYLRKLLAICLDAIATAVPETEALTGDALAKVLRRLRSGQREIRRGGPLLDLDLEILELMAAHAGLIAETEPGALADDLERTAEDAANAGDVELAIRAREAQVECLRKAGHPNPGDLINALGRLGQLLEGAEQAGEAVVVSREAVALAKGTDHEPFALHALARRLSAADQPRQALETSTSAVAIMSERIASGTEQHPNALAILLISLNKRAEECGTEIEVTETLAAATAVMLERSGPEPGGDVGREVFAAYPVVNAALHQGARDSAERIFASIAKLADRRPDSLDVQSARSLLGSNLVSHAIAAGDLDAAHAFLKSVGDSARQLPDDRLVAERGKAAANLIAAHLEGDDPEAAARVAVEAKDALLSPAYLAKRRADLGEDQAEFITGVEALCGKAGRRGSLLSRLRRGG